MRSSSRSARRRSSRAEAGVDVVALSLPAQYVVVAAADHPERFGRLVLISPTGFGRFKGGTSATPGRLYRFLRATGIGRVLFAFLARRRVIHWFLAQIFANPAAIPDDYERYCWRTCQQPGRSGRRLRSCPERSTTPVRRMRTGGSRTRRLLVFGDHPRFTDPPAADALIAANVNLQAWTINESGDLPQVERPDETAAIIDAFLA